MSAVPLRNVYYMLTYAYEVLKSKEYERLDREVFDSVYDLFATLLLCGTNDLTDFESGFERIRDFATI